MATNEDRELGVVHIFQRSALGGVLGFYFPAFVLLVFIFMLTFVVVSFFFFGSVFYSLFSILLHLQSYIGYIIQWTQVLCDHKPRSGMVFVLKKEKKLYRRSLNQLLKHLLLITEK